MLALVTDGQFCCSSPDSFEDLGEHIVNDSFRPGWKSYLSQHSRIEVHWEYFLRGFVAQEAPEAAGQTAWACQRWASGSGPQFFSALRWLFTPFDSYQLYLVYWLVPGEQLSSFLRV